MAAFGPDRPDRMPGSTGSSPVCLSVLSIHAFTEEQLKSFTDKLSTVQLKKGEFLVKAGEISSRLNFISKGSFRQYNIMGSQTLNFYTENQWVTDIDSFMEQQPSKNFIEAMEDAELVSITLVDLHQLMEQHPGFLMLNKLTAAMVMAGGHLALQRTKAMDQRYKELMREHPEWMNRFPLMHIASYLGMTPETLSRVRARLS